MRERVFVARRQEGWEQLEALLGAADRGGLRRLGADGLQELALRYRSATTDLAAAQSRGYSAETRAYLNRLTARAHAYVYAGSSRGGWSRLAEFFGTTFPREVRRSHGAILGCAALFVAAAVVAYWLVAQRPLNVYALLPAGLIPVVEKPLHDSNFAFDRSFAPLMASAIITNNVKVAMLAFAGGMTLGYLTIWSVLSNGLMVGALGALFAAKGFGLDFWATVAPHGVIELTSIQISAAAGLLLAQAIVAPGRLRRIDALKANARRAGVLMIGVAGLLVLAGTIEGFVSPQRTSIEFRIVFGALTTVLLAAYLGFGGRKRPAAARISQANERIPQAVDATILRALLVVGFSLVSFSAAGAKEANEIQVDVPAVFAPLLGKIASAYQEANQQEVVTVVERAFADALHDLDAASADVAILDHGAGGSAYADHPLAVVPYAIVIDARVGVTSLSSAQISSIFSGGTTNWREVGGSDVPISVIRRPAASGTTMLFSSLFGSVGATGILVDNTSSAVVGAVREIRGAIGYVGLAYADLDGVRVVAIDGVGPSAATIASGKYRFFTTIHAVTAAQPASRVSRFLSFATTRRELLHEAGFYTIFETGQTR